MSSDRHYKEGQNVPTYALRCASCGRLFRGRSRQRFGSNACRQRSYRERQAKQLVAAGRPAREAAAAIVQGGQLARQKKDGGARIQPARKGA